jgi:ribosomal protein L29
MKRISYKDTSDANLEKALREKREAFRAFRFAASGTKAKNVHEGRNLRKDVARLLTEMRRRQG